jgi:hypothetical protein
MTFFALVCRDDHKLAERPFYGGIPKVVDSQNLQKMRKEAKFPQKMSGLRREAAA